MGEYSYNPAKAGERGVDRMRFELGDVMVEGGAETCALTDEEIGAMLKLYPARWNKAKLALVESVLYRFSYEVDTKVGPLSLALRDRCEGWKALRDDLKKKTGGGVPSAAPESIAGPPYFYAGMMDTPKGRGNV